MSDEMQKLPPGWISAPLSNLTLPFDTIEPKAMPEDQFRYIDIGSIDNAAQRIRNPKTFLGRDAPSRARRVVRSGDVLFSTVRTYLKNIARVPAELDGALTSTGICVLRPSEAVDADFLFFAVIRDQFIRRVGRDMDGTLYPAVKDSDIYTAFIPLPPLAEQRRIVAKLEELLVRVEACRKRLEQVPRLLKRFRQSVLAAAFSGKLTIGWREIHDDESEDHPHFESPDEPPQQLPERWRWVKWKGLASKDRYAFKRGPFGSSLKKNIFVSEGYKVYEQCNPINDDCNLGNYYITEEKFKELEAFKVEAGDFLISCSGVTLGRITRIPEKFQEGIINQALLKVSLDEALIRPQYFINYFRSDLFQGLIFDNAQGSAIPNIKGVKELKELPIPLPPLAEQQEIIHCVEAFFRVADAVDHCYRKAQEQLDKLPQSILAKAFRGELVAQDRTDEPRTLSTV